MFAVKMFDQRSAKLPRTNLLVLSMLLSHSHSGKPSKIYRDDYWQLLRSTAY